MIPNRSYQRYDGFTKLKTKDCKRCEWYRENSDAELCGWGEAFKYLVKTEKPRKCEVKNRKQEGLLVHSVGYIDEILNV